ncbi:ATP-binding protein [Polaromonas sp. JS666]|uniref:ATP-binding protein n=1 Tax=Polaromonas sp. (strain JS666 / ATCC BAA-500) TaxID=296591 RepID=UPI00088165A5|nr:ATP-binding protein [Polaromonas sp. JS666]SDM42659.1 AAA domain-containing protein [Polaromonas sp. JS666]
MTTFLGAENFVECDISRISDRQAMLPMHPMLDRNYVLDTDVIEHAYGLIFEWAMLRKSGLVFTGRQRNGKTYACYRIIERLSRDAPHLPVLYMSAERALNERKEKYFMRQLERWRFPVQSSSRNASFQQIFSRYLITQCMNRGNRSVLLIVDEAQCMTIKEFSYLIEIWNLMRREGYQLCTVLIGQPELKALLGSSEEADYEEVKGRFFVKDYPFLAVKTQAELRNLLRQYDDELFFPDQQKDWSYSRFFAHASYDAGWRLVDETVAFWEALNLVAQGGAKGNGFRMTWITDAVHHFLTDCLASQPLLPSNREQWTATIQQVANLDMLG